MYVKQFIILCMILIIFFDFSLLYSNGQFLELSKQLKALVQMFPMSMNIQTKTKVFLALQSLETDITKMSQLYKLVNCLFF